MCNEDPTLLLFRVSHDRGGGVGGLIVCGLFFFWFFGGFVLQKMIRVRLCLCKKKEN